MNKIILDECSTGDQTIILGLQIFTITNCNCVHLDCRLLSWISLETDIFGTIHCKSGKLADFVLFPEFYLHSFQSFAKKLLYYLSSRDPPLHSARYIYRRSHSVDIEEVVDERKTLRWYFKYRYHMLYTLTDAKEQALHTEWKKKDYPEYNIFHICSFS